MEKIISAIEDLLIVDRDPTARLALVLHKLVEHPDIRKVLNHLALVENVGLSEKEHEAQKGIIERLGEALNSAKLSSSSDGRRLRQELMNIAAPKAGSGLVRATARLLGLKSYRGLLAGQSRVQEYFDMIDAEGGSGDSESDGDLDKEETRANIILRRESPWIAPDRKKTKRYDGPSSIALS